MTAEPEPGADAVLAAALLAVDPTGLGGAVVRGGPGPARDAWIERLRALLPDGVAVGRLPAGVSDDRLLGGLDLASSLAAGRPVVERGLLAAHDGGVVIAPMAERMDEGVAARIAAVLDAGEVVLERDGLAARLPARLALVLLDEGREPEERAATVLRERLAFAVSADTPPTALPFDRESIARARRVLDAATAPDAVVEALCAAAASVGLASLRAPVLAVRAARAHAALHGRAIAETADAQVAARLVLAPRALVAPEPAASDEAPAEAEPELDRDDSEGASKDGAHDVEAAERTVAAVRAALPAQLIEAIAAENARAARAPRRSGAGAVLPSTRRGRPMGSRPGALRPGARLDLVATLRAAAPWRRLRGGEAGGRIPIRAGDFRIRRFVKRREATTILAVDASGSAAFQRLAEAKGAVELLLAKAYVSRARVALIAFRQTGAEVRLAPTRSLTRARRSLADLPGGGGTPLADGLDAALALALAERARERTPTIVVLTDGRANIARDGSPGREGAERDAMAAAARIGEAGVRAAFLDTSPRPQPGGDRFARAMRAVYAPLPYADAGRVSAAVDGLADPRA